MKEMISNIIHNVISPVYLRYNRKLFAEQSSPDQQRELFRQFVSYVEVEVHSFCNRTCWFCPNSFIDRRTTRNYMDETRYLQMLDDLAAIEYSHTIGFSRYNEPTADEIFVKRLAQAHTRLPKASLLAHTNSDYLDSRMMCLLRDNGLGWLNIQLYPPTKEFDVARMEQLAERIKKRIPEVALRLVGKENGKGIWYEGQFGDMEVRMYGQDFSQTGINRGGLAINNAVSIRKKPCLYATWGVFIDWNGNVMPCCNVRSDNPKEKDCAIGMLTACPGSIFKVYASREAADWRKAMYGFGSKSGVCAVCSATGPPDTAINRMFVKLIGSFKGPK